MKQAKYHWKTPLNDYGIACEKKTLFKNYIIHDHDSYEIEIYTDGSIYHLLNGSVSTITGGDFYILSPKDTHSINLVTPSISLYTIALYPPKLPEYINELILSANMPLKGHLSAETLAKIISLTEELKEETFKKRDYSGLVISSLVTLILVELLGTGINETNYKSTAQIETFKKITNYIAENFRSQITLEDIAKEAFLSPKYFSNAFSAYMGTSFVSYLTKVRIFHAQKLLVTTAMSITDIAAESGFNSFSSFYRAFHRQSNLPPSEYRRKYKLYTNII